MTETTAGSATRAAPARDPCSQRRVGARMVRLLPVRHRRGAGVRRPVLSEERSGRRHAAGVPDLRRRLRGAAARRHPVRHPGRPLRAQAGAGGDPAHDRHRHHRDRAFADLRPDRLLGAAAAGRDARHPGAWRRRRIWRRRDLPGRECAGRAARLLGQLCAARRLHRQFARRRRLCAGHRCCRTTT